MSPKSSIPQAARSDPHALMSDTWADIPERYGPYTTCYNRFVRWRAAGVWDRILDAVSKAYNGKIQMIDSSVVRVHQHAANGKKADAAVAWAVPAAGSRPKSTRSSMRKACRSISN